MAWPVLYLVGACILTYYLVNFLFSKTYLFRCLRNMPTASFWVWLMGINTFKVAPPLANMLHCLQFFSHIHEKERIFCIWLLYRPAIFLFKPETVEVLLNNNKTIDKSSEYRCLHPLFGKGLIISNGDKWRSRRKIINPAFHHSILDEFMPVFHKQSMILVRKLLKENKHQQCVDIQPLMNKCSLDIICETAMGVSIGAQEDKCSEFYEAVQKLEDRAIDGFMKSWLWFITRYFSSYSSKTKSHAMNIEDITKNLIKKKRELLKEEKSETWEDKGNSNSDKIKKRKAFLELLLEYQHTDDSFTDDDIMDEVKTFLHAGHGTVAVSLAFTLHLLGLHPEIQENVIREIDFVFQRDTERPVNCEDLRLMEYTERVIKESNRLYPPAPLIARELKEDIQVLNYTIPPGALCAIFTSALHRDPESFPNPDKFDPDRFLPENSRDRHPYAYIPFSAGPRGCIGQKFAYMEEKTVLANIFRNLRILSLDKLDAFHLMPTIRLRNVHPLRARFTPRSLDNDSSL